MQPHQYFLQQPRLIALLLVCGAAMVGGRIGVLVGRPADMLFAVDGGMVGLIAGAVIGSQLPASQLLHPALRAVAAGLGVLLPALVLIGSARIAPEVLWSMTVVTMLCSSLISLLIRLARRTRR